MTESNVFSKLGDNIKVGVEKAMSEAGNNVCEEMKETLIQNGHTGTGALIDSIGYEVTKTETDISVDVSIAPYAEFIERGTGAAHGVEGGREGSWRYQDREGNWHTTDGMDADPFIAPAIEELTANMQVILGNQIHLAVSRGTKGGESSG